MILPRLTAALLLFGLLTACASTPPVPERPRPAMTRVAQDEAPAPAPRRPAPLPQRVETPKACANCPTPDPDFAPTLDEVPDGIENVPDAKVIDEPKSRHGNPQSYEVLGKRYEVMRSVPKSFRETGRASWYGKKFHGRRTANGETYDMFKMTAAHKTLPLPSYVRVSHRGNNRSVVVRINDRGPFHPGRIIDLSYAAAVKLDLLHHGSGDVVIEVITPEQARAAREDPSDSGKPRYLEVGRFIDPIDAVALQDRLQNLGFGETELLQTPGTAGDGFDNVLRIGPFKNFTQLEKARVKLGLQEITAIPVAD